MKKFILFFALLSIYFSAFSQAPSIEWQKCYGGQSDDNAQAVIQTNEGQYMIVGTSFGTDSFILLNHGSGDFWVIKADTNGNALWEIGLGGSGDDGATYIYQTQDSGFIIAGTSISNDGDLAGINNHGNGDIWVVKVSANGSTQWQKLLGGSLLEDGSYIQQTKDGGYFVAGYSGSSDGDVNRNQGGNDYWIIKLNQIGGIEWQKSYGGTNDDALFSAAQTFEGGYILAGLSYSNNGDVSGHHGDSTTSDYWIVKVDSSGILQWQKSYGGSGIDIAYSIQQTKDSNYVVAGRSNSTDGDVTGNNGNADYWVIKIDQSGTLLWEKSLGSSGDDYANSIQQTRDGGYIVAGFGGSNTGEISGNHGNGDYWIVKLDTSGILEWENSYGGSSNDFGYFIKQTSDNGYIVTGNSESNDNEVSGNHGGFDMWTIKLQGTCSPNSSTSYDTILLSQLPYNWNGLVFTSSGSQTVQLTNSKGCDSVATLTLTINSPKGIQNLSGTSPIHLSPNPNKGSFTLQTSGSIGNAYTITDMLGHIIMQRSITSDNETIELPEVAEGIYTIVVKEAEPLRFVIMK